MKLIKEIQAHDNYVIDVLFSPNKQIMISSGMDAKIKLWSTNSWKLINTLEECIYLI